MAIYLGISLSFCSSDDSTENDTEPGTGKKASDVKAPDDFENSVESKAELSTQKNAVNEEIFAVIEDAFGEIPEEASLTPEYQKSPGSQFTTLVSSLKKSFAAPGTGLTQDDDEDEDDLDFDVAVGDDCQPLLANLSGMMANFNEQFTGMDDQIALLDDEMQASAAAQEAYTITELDNEGKYAFHYKFEPVEESFFSPTVIIGLGASETAFNAIYGIDLSFSDEDSGTSFSMEIDMTMWADVNQKLANITVDMDMQGQDDDGFSGAFEFDIDAGDTPSVKLQFAATDEETGDTDMTIDLVKTDADNASLTVSGTIDGESVARTILMETDGTTCEVTSVD